MWEAVERERLEDKKMGVGKWGGGERMINGNTEEKDAYSPGRNGPPSLIFLRLLNESYEN